MYEVTTCQQVYRSEGRMRDLVSSLAMMINGFSLTLTVCNVS